MKIHPLPIDGTAIVEMNPFHDERGVFSRWFCQRELAPLLGDRQIVNVNFSRTVDRGAVRGIHYQHPPMAEMKLIRCLRGRLYDVIVDLRHGSPTFLQWHGEELTADNMKLMVLPEGVAHGVQALEDDMEMLYLTTQFYSPEHDAGIRYDDPRIGIDWPRPVTTVSDKDRQHPLLADDYRGLVL